MNVHTAVHVDHGARRVGGQVGGEKQEDVRDVLRTAKAAKRYAGENLPLFVRSNLANVDGR
jgi:hypothetical protein